MLFNIKKPFSYVISQNKGDSEGITKGLLTMSLHPFDDHSKCSDKWCIFLQTPINRRNTKIFHMKYL